MMVFLDITHCRHCGSSMNIPYGCTCYNINTTREGKKNMNKKEIEEELNKLKTRINELENKLDKELDKESEPKGWFKPEYDEMYYCINTSGQINCYRWDGGEFDLYHYNNHNCFRSKKEAQEYLDYTNALKEAEKPFIKGDYNYYFYYTINREEIELQPDYNCINQGSTYLGQDRDVAQAFVEKWKPQILKFEFDVWE